MNTADECNRMKRSGRSRTMNKEEASGWGFLQPAPNAEAIASLMQRKSKSVSTADMGIPIGNRTKPFFES